MKRLLVVLAACHKIMKLVPQSLKFPPKPLLQRFINVQFDHCELNAGN